MNNFYRTRFVYRSLSLIAEKRAVLLQDLVAYTNDSRYPRRLRMLSQLAAYEQSLLQKSEEFETDNSDDFDLAMNRVRGDVESIVNISA